MRVTLLGGFLGAGKTTAVQALAKTLIGRGERVAIITNDQGHALVDTALCRTVSTDNADVAEIGGGCFCCQYDQLDAALITAADRGATVALAEAVGSCTDLVATVLSPLAERQMGRFQLTPLSVLIDPQRAADIASGAFAEDVAYLFRKQIEEADVVVLTRSDLFGKDSALGRSAEAFVRELHPHVPIVHVSGTRGDGISQWIATTPRGLSSPLDIDYDRYAAAEAALGWANGRVLLKAASPFSPATLIDAFLSRLSDLPLAHLKLFIESPNREQGSSANLVRRGATPTYSGAALPDKADSLNMVVNARVAIAPELLDRALRDALDAVCPADADVAWTEFDSFEPGRPVPVHRYATRCDPGGEGACCAAFYEDAAVQYLLGDSYHPGGIDLTLTMAKSLTLTEDATVLDVACGKGTSLKAVLAAYPVSGVGLDIRPPQTDDGAWGRTLTFAQGDIHQTTFGDAQFDALLCECALSTFANQGMALDEMYRVLKPGGTIAISDMVTNGPIPPQLSEWVHLGTCLSHARSLDDYAALVEAAKFEVIATEDATWALRQLMSQIKRRLLGAALAKASGILPENVDIDVVEGRKALKLAASALDDRIVGYGYLIARKPKGAPR